MNFSLSKQTEVVSQILVAVDDLLSNKCYSEAIYCLEGIAKCSLILSELFVLHAHVQLGKLYLKFTKNTDDALRHATAALQICQLEEFRVTVPRSLILEATSTILDVYKLKKDVAAFHACTLQGIEFAVSHNSLEWLGRFTLNSSLVSFENDDLPAAVRTLKSACDVLGKRADLEALEMRTFFELLEAQFYQLKRHPDALAITDSASSTFKDLQQRNSVNKFLAIYCSLLNLSMNCTTGRSDQSDRWISLLDEASRQPSRETQPFFKHLICVESPDCLKVYRDFFSGILAMDRSNISEAVQNFSSVGRSSDLSNKPNSDFKMLIFLANSQLVSVCMMQGELQTAASMLSSLIDGLNSAATDEVKNARAGIIHALCAQYAIISGAAPLHARNHLKRAYRKFATEKQLKIFCRLLLAVLRLHNDDDSGLDESARLKNLSKSKHEAVKLLTDPRSTARVCGLMALSFTHAESAQFRDAQKVLAECSEICLSKAPPDGNPQMMAVCHFLSAHLLFLAGQSPQALQSIQQAHQLASQTGDVSLQLSVCRLFQQCVWATDGNSNILASLSTTIQKLQNALSSQRKICSENNFSSRVLTWHSDIVYLNIRCSNPFW
eukprot:149353_1